MISIMNGVHCQVSTRMIDSIGNWLTQSTLPTPNGDRTQLISPKTGLYIDVFHTSAAAVGITRKGVMSSVRATLRPRNFWSRIKAKVRPMTVDSRTVLTVSTTVFTTALRNRSSVKTLP
jgi:hypothetical protein